MILDRNLETPLYRQIYAHYKHAILSQSLKENDKLDSIRNLTLKHRISKTTVEKAFNQLIIEGFIQSQPKSGHYVLPVKVYTGSKHRVDDLPDSDPQYLNTKHPREAYEFEGFKKAVLQVLYYQSDQLYYPPIPMGEVAFKETLMRFLNHERGIIAHPSQCVISSGLQNHLTIIANLKSQRRVGYIKPLFPAAETAFKLLGFKPIACDTIEQLLENTLDFIYISPSNLYPSGEVVPINQRIELIEYARKNKAYILEDDYNYIYRHNAYQIPSIQGLSQGKHVIYIGSFARQTLPSIRMSYMVLPPNLTQRYHRTPQLSQTVSVLDQLTMKALMDSGHYQKQLKKLSAYSKKQNDSIRQLLELFSHQKAIRFLGLDSNLHVIFEVDSTTLKERLVTEFTRLNWTHNQLKEWPNRIILPYHGFSETSRNQLRLVLTNLTR